MEGELVYVTGGARSGKSSFAEDLVMGAGHRILYIATALPLDEEMEDRIRLHRESRPPFWRTLEAYRGIKDRLDSAGELFHGIILDCITLMITNIMLDAGPDCGGWSPGRVAMLEKGIMEEVASVLKGIRTWSNTGVVVSNEVGMGIVPDNPLGRVFRDIAGRANRMIAREADRAYFLVSGIPVRIK